MTEIPRGPIVELGKTGFMEFECGNCGEQVSTWHERPTISQGDKLRIRLTPHVCQKEGICPGCGERHLLQDGYCAECNQEIIDAERYRV